MAAVCALRPPLQPGRVLQRPRRRGGRQPGRQLGLAGTAPLLGGGAVSRASAGRGRSHAFDPDAYELDPDDVYDPDEYDYGLGTAGSAARPPAAAVAAAASAVVQPLAAAVAASLGGTLGGPQAEDDGAEEAAADGDPTQQQPRRRRHPRDDLSRGARMLLLVGPSLHRLACRLSTAVAATGKVTWQLGGEALQGLRHSLDRTRQEAAQGFADSPAGKKVQAWRTRLEEAQHDLPEDLWGKVMWVWDRPHVQKLRLTITMANFSIRLPALVALVATQIGLLSTSLSLPMLAPLLLGTGMLLRSIRTNASYIFPRIGLLVVLLWLLWFANSVIQNTVAYLRKQGAIDQRVATNINSAAELAVLLTAAVILLSMLGVNVSALLLPAGIAAAVAAKDLSHNFLAGAFLMIVQPFRLGDRVGVTLPAGSPASFGAGGAWFEGVCEKVDLRYTSLRQGKRRLMVPNSAFLQQPFMITEDVPAGGPPSPGAPPGPGEQAPQPGQQPFTTYDGRNVWQTYMNGGPVHEELAAEQAAAAAAAQDAGPPRQAPLNGQQQYANGQQFGVPPAAAPNGQQGPPNGQQYAQPSQPNGQQYAQPAPLNGQAASGAVQQQQAQYQPPPPGVYSSAAPSNFAAGGVSPPPPQGGMASFPAGAPPPGAYPPHMYYQSHPGLASHPLPPQAFM